MPSCVLLVSRAAGRQCTETTSCQGRAVQLVHNAVPYRFAAGTSVGLADAWRVTAEASQLFEVHFAFRISPWMHSPLNSPVVLPGYDPSPQPCLLIISLIQQRNATQHASAANMTNDWLLLAPASATAAPLLNTFICTLHHSPHVIFRETKPINCPPLIFNEPVCLSPDQLRFLPLLTATATSMHTV